MPGGGRRRRPDGGYCSRGEQKVPGGGRRRRPGGGYCSRGEQKVPGGGRRRRPGGGYCSRGEQKVPGGGGRRRPGGGFASQSKRKLELTRLRGYRETCRPRPREELHDAEDTTALRAGVLGLDGGAAECRASPETWPGSSSRRSTRSGDGSSGPTGKRGDERTGLRGMRRRKLGVCAGRSGSCS